MYSSCFPLLPRWSWWPAFLLLGFIPLAGAETAETAIDECAVLAALDFEESVGAAVSLQGAMVEARGQPGARCRVTGRIAPEVGVEVWLPADTWNGKLLVTGCEQRCGSLRTHQMEDAAARGYATATTDGGYSVGEDADSRWAWNAPEREEDFGHRAVHVTALLAKALVAAFYGEREQYAYFRGCSNGGRQGLVAAQRYPEDFDGIIAGAPFHQTLSVPHMIWADRVNRDAQNRPLLRGGQIELLHQAVLAACDAADGLSDGIVGDPERCAFDPALLMCPEGAKRDCLDAAQVEAVRRIYSGPLTSAGQRLAPFGAAPGSEFTWARQLLGRDDEPPSFRVVGENWLRYHAFEPDPPQDAALAEFDFDRDPERLAASASRIGFEPDLDGFQRRYGRLIVHHGWADESLQPAHTIEYWRRLVRNSGGEQKLADFARLFLLPGVQHCGGGPGAGDIDYLTAIERWVEQDEAPDMLIAWRTRDSAPVTVRQPLFPLAGEVLLKRPVFPWPEVAYYRGEGDVLEPASYRRVSR